MNPNILDANDRAKLLTAFQALLGALPWLLFGLANIAMQLKIGQAWPGSKPVGLMLVTHPYLVFNWLILLGLAAGLFAGFPRWTFSYLGWGVLNLALWANTGFYGLPVDLTCLPFAAAIILPLLLRRSLLRRTAPPDQPIRLVPAGRWNDLTLLLLAVYIFFSSINMIYDENHHPALLFFIAATALAVALGAWGYFYFASPLRRALSLTAGLVLSLLLVLWNSLTWDAAAYYGLPPSSHLRGILINLLSILFLSALMLGLGFLAERLQRHKPA